MNCENYLSLIDDLAENRLDENKSQKIISHIISCQTCEAAFEARFDEKELCAEFIFEVKPLTNLSTQFQARLKIEKQKESISNAVHFSLGEKLKNIFSFPNLKPILVSAALLLVFGFLYLGLRNSNPNQEKKITAQSEMSNSHLNQNAQTFKPNPPANEKSKAVLQKNSTDNPAKQVLIDKTGIVKEKTKIATINATSIKKPPVRQNELPKPVEIPAASRKEAMSPVEIQTFMADTSRQLEKIEMLFRSFRNARLIEESDSFDISYENQQAQKLLKENIKLRKLAEAYGSYEVEETLQITESLLSEIANLRGNPSRERVISIKRQVSDRNIIAALQVY